MTGRLHPHGDEVPGEHEPSPDDTVVRAKVFLQAGEVFATAVPTAVTTVLGSCVAVCLFAPTAKAGGLNHFLFPATADPFEDSARIGTAAMRLLLERMLDGGVRKQELRAKVFGGAGSLCGEALLTRIGDQNVALARRVLESEGIPVLDGDVGGARGRKLIFHTDTGDAWVQKL